MNLTQRAARVHLVMRQPGGALVVAAVLPAGLCVVAPAVAVSVAAATPKAHVDFAVPL